MKLQVCFSLKISLTSLSPSLLSLLLIPHTQAREHFALALHSFLIFDHLEVADAALISHKDERKRKRTACWGYLTQIIVIHDNQTSRHHLVLGTPPAIQLERHGELTRPQSASHAHPPAGVIARPSEGSQAHNFSQARNYERVICKK